jgi:hypothetical protein
MLGATAGGMVAWFDPAGLRAPGIAVLILVAAWGALRLALALRRSRRRHTLSALRELSPAAFERAVAAWFARDGWLVELRGKSGVGGNAPERALGWSNLLPAPCNEAHPGGNS